jgi:hypothetical protein
MSARTNVSVLIAMLAVLWAWLNTGWSAHPAVANAARRIPADSTKPVFGFYADRPTLVTIEGRACSTRRPDECWDADGIPEIPPLLRPAKTLMQVSWNGGDIPYARQGAYREVVACTNADCRDFIASQRVAVGRRFISCSGAHPHSVYFWSNAIRERGAFAPAGDFSAASGEFHFAIYPDHPEAVEVCASNWHSWFVPAP